MEIDPKFACISGCWKSYCLVSYCEVVEGRLSKMGWKLLRSDLNGTNEWVS